MTDRELMQQALEALDGLSEPYDVLRIQTALHERLAQPEQEPVAYLCENAVGHKYFRWKKPSSTYKPIALYTAPPQRTWVGLTEQDLDYLCNLAYTGDEEFALAVQAKLKEKNT